MIVAMDIGNTNIKAAVFEGSRLVKRWRCATDPGDDFRSIWHYYGRFVPLSQPEHAGGGGNHDFLRRADHQLYHRAYVPGLFPP